MIDAGTQLGLRVSHAVMEDEAVLTHLALVFAAVVAREEVRRASGDTLWSAVKYAFIPSWPYRATAVAAAEAAAAEAAAAEAAEDVTAAAAAASEESEPAAAAEVDAAST